MKKVSSSSCSSGGGGGGGALRGHWKPCEDMKLQELVSLYGPQNWNLIAQKLQGRSGKSCRLRWFNQLDPRINRRPFSGEEEARLMAAQAAYGNRWAAIARLFPGRTDNSLKNHWHVITARRSRRSRDAMAAPSSSSAPLAAPLEPAASPSAWMTDRFQAAEEEEEERFRRRREILAAVDGKDEGESNGGGDSGGSCSSRSTCCNSFNSTETAAAAEEEAEGGGGGGATATRWLLGAVDRVAEPTAQMKKPRKTQPSPFIDFLGVEEEEEEEEEDEEKKEKLLTCNFFSL